MTAITPPSCSTLLRFLLSALLDRFLASCNCVRLFSRTTFSAVLTTCSWIGSANAFLILSGGLFFGRLYDRGYFYSLMIGGSTLQVLCLFLLSLTKPNQFYQVFLCQGIGFGLTASMSFIPSVAVLSHHFKQRRAIMMTIVASGSPLGGTVYPILLNNLLSKMGFSNSIRVAAVANSALLLLSCLLMRTRLPPQRKHTRYCEVLKKSSRDYAYIFSSLGIFFFSAGSYYPMFYLQLDSSIHGLGEKFSFYTIVMVNGANFVGRATTGFIASYLGILNTSIGATSCTAAVIVAMIGLTTRVGVVSIGVFFGYFAGAFIALSAPLVALLTSDLSELGARIGISFTLSVGLGVLIGPPLAGALLTSSYAWWRPALFCGVSTSKIPSSHLGLSRYSAWLV
ncbi:major facilitator superfamily domain-containing protein [Melanogaster broomeanus]|nr:major facilitator superfamily domain-containing protein [Melanogaster broomeanus]